MDLWEAYLTLYPNSPEYFWRLTPSMFKRMMKAGDKRQIYDHNAATRNTWYNAVFSRTDKLPELEKILYSPGDAHKPVDASEDELNEALMKALDKLNSSLDEEAQSR